jgi:hypothetical protein
VLKLVARRKRSSPAKNGRLAAVMTGHNAALAGIFFLNAKLLPGMEIQETCAG